MSTVRIPTGWAKGRRAVYAKRGGQLLKIAGQKARARKRKRNPSYKLNVARYVDGLVGSGAAVGGHVLFGKVMRPIMLRGDVRTVRWASVAWLLANTVGAASIEGNATWRRYRPAYVACAGFYPLITAGFVMAGVAPEQALNMHALPPAPTGDQTTYDQNAMAILDPLGLIERVIT